MIIAVLANGEWDPVWGKNELASVDYLICADGGADAAIAAGRLPDVIVGDLDSVSKETLAVCRKNRVEIVSYLREKDETDLQLAVKRAEKKCLEAKPLDQEGSNIYIYGAFGGRLDHLLGNLVLALAYADRGICLRYKDPAQEAWVIWKRTEIFGKIGQNISLLPYGGSVCVSTDGLKYTMDHDELFMDSPRGISNEFKEKKCVLEVHRGKLLVILNTLGDEYTRG